MKTRLLVLAILIIAIIPTAGGCTNSDTIIGQWFVEVDWALTAPGSYLIEFFADNTFQTPKYTGNWSLSGKRIEFVFATPSQATYTGTVRSRFCMSGTMKNAGGNYGTWRATRGAIPAAKPGGQGSPAGD